MDETQDVFALPVHPWAAQFPMRTDEDLQSMAASIKANGVRVPVVLGMAVCTEGGAPELCLVDGRNRLAACRIAGVVPPHITLNGQDIDAYIADVNLERRDLTKGQKAMLIAQRYPNADERGRGKKSEAGKIARVAGFSPDRLNAARSVIAFCPEMVPQVIAGVLGLDEALQEAQRRRAVTLSTETRFGRLQGSDPDFAVLVNEQRMSLSEAEAAAADRRDTRLRAVAGAFKTLRLLDDAVSCLGGDLLTQIAQAAREHPDEVDFDLRTRSAHWAATVKKLHEALQ